jgi:hypothetical protein
MKALLVICFATMPIIALACGQGEAKVFNCKTRAGKPVEVCQARDTVIYRFGAKPDMMVKVPTDHMKWEQFIGSGGTTNILYFPNGETTYQVSHVGMFKGPADEDAWIDAMRGDVRLAEIRCANGSTSSFDSTALKATTQDP